MVCHLEPQYGLGLSIAVLLNAMLFKRGTVAEEQPRLNCGAYDIKSAAPAAVIRLPSRLPIAICLVLKPVENEIKQSSVREPVYQSLPMDSSYSTPFTEPV